jgi:tetratricopeptide (TPR) repeat protein
MICPKCGYDNTENSKFCSGCGAPLESTVVTAAPTSRKKKKAPIIIAVSIAALLLISILGVFIYNSLPSTKYKKADAAFAAEDYENAILLYTEAGDYSDAPEKLKQSEIRLHYEKALALKDSQNYLEAVKEFVLAEGYLDSNDKILSIGEKLTKDEKYEDAITVFESISQGKESEYYFYSQAMLKYQAKEYEAAIEYFSKAGFNTLDALKKTQECQYALGKISLENRDFSDAKGHFMLAMGYSDSKALISSCDLMSTKEIMDEGKLNTALEKLKELPEDAAYKDITAADLIAKLEANKKWLDLCGIWTSTGGKMKSSESTSSYEKGWYYDFQEGDVHLEVTCQLQDDGTVLVKTIGFVNAFTNYATEQTDLKRTIINLSTSETMNDLGTIKIDDNTSITLKDGKITSSYSVTERSGKTYTYKTDVTYGKRTVAY